MNSTFGTIGKATTDKCVNWLKSWQQNASFCFSMKNIIILNNKWSCSEVHLQNLDIFCFQKGYFPSMRMKIYFYWTSCHVSFILSPLFVNFRNSKWTVFLLDFCILNLWWLPLFVCLVYSLRSNIWFESYSAPRELLRNVWTKWALI